MKINFDVIRCFEFHHKRVIFLTKLIKKTLITYEGKTLTELKKDFKNAIDDYIEHCKENGLEFHKSYSGSFNIRIPVDLHARIAAMAQSEGISLNAFVKESLMRAVM